MKNETKSASAAPPRTCGISFRTTIDEREAIRQAWIAARASEPRLTLAEWLRRKGAEGPK